MFALVLREVDARRCFLHRRERGVDGLVHRRDEREDRAVVRRVGRDVEDGDTIDGGDGGANGVNDRLVTTFGKVRNALDEFHRLDVGGGMMG